MVHKEPLINRIFIWLRRLEDALLALLLTSMIGVAVLQIILRNFFDSGLFWGDSAVRTMVLWVAMLGAMVASRNDEHIRIDLAGQYLTGPARVWVSRLVNAFVCVVLLIFSWYSLEFVRYEYEDQAIAFASVPAWLCESIMPAGAFIMAMRYALLTVRPK